MRPEEGSRPQGIPAPLTDDVQRALVELGDGLQAPCGLVAGEGAVEGELGALDRVGDRDRIGAGRGEDDGVVGLGVLEGLGDQESAQHQRGCSDRSGGEDA